MENLQNQIEQLLKENEKLRNQVNETSEKQKRKQEKTKKTLSWTWKLFAGKNLNKSFNNWFVEFHADRKVAPDTSANLLTALVTRFVRVRTLSLVLLFFTLIPSLISLWVLIKQNNLIETQNSLVEASRKSSYGFQLSNIFDAVDGKPYTNGIKGRIVGLSHTLKPYHILQDNNELSEKLYSPERSQLLLFLVNSNLNSSQLKAIFESANFSHCDLRGMNLSGKYLSGANLTNSNFEGANLTKANFNGANLKKANLKSTKFSEGNAKKANLNGADLSGADMRYADLSGSNLIESNLTNSNLNFGVLKNVCFTDAIMKKTNFTEANLENAYFKNGFNLDSERSEQYVESKYRIKKDSDGFDTFVAK